MRLISQDGMIDVPYENLTIAVDNDNDDGKVHILARGIVEYLSIIIAVYSNTDKALKVMEMLREYKETKEIRSIPLTKSLMESFSNVKMENFEIYTDGTGDYLKVDIVKKVECFKFPADEEVEV